MKTKANFKPIKFHWTYLFFNSRGLQGKSNRVQIQLSCLVNIPRLDQIDKSFPNDRFRLVKLVLSWPSSWVNWVRKFHRGNKIRVQYAIIWISPSEWEIEFCQMSHFDVRNEYRVSHSNPNCNLDSKFWSPL